MKRITVLLVDDHTVVREGFRALLEMEADIQVVGEASDGRQAIRMARKLQPDVVVMDIAMPLLNGLEATEQIHKFVPAAKVLLLSAHADDEYLEQVTRVGAAGYLIKQTSAHTMSNAIRELQRGNTLFSPSIAERLHDLHPDPPGRRRRTRKKGVTLTSRQVEVLQLVAEGKANKQIARELGISIKTVEKHRQLLMSNLDLHDAAGLTRYAIAAGIIESRVRVTIVP